MNGISGNWTLVSLLSWPHKGVVTRGLRQGLQPWLQRALQRALQRQLQRVLQRVCCSVCRSVAVLPQCDSVVC